MHQHRSAATANSKVNKLIHNIICEGTGLDVTNIGLPSLDWSGIIKLVSKPATVLSVGIMINSALTDKVVTCHKKMSKTPTFATNQFV